MKTFNILLFSFFTIVSMAQQQKRFPKLSEAENQTLTNLFNTNEQAQAFATNMKDINGVAKIENVALDNGNFELEKVANVLAFEKVTVSKATTINFLATNSIELSETSMMPNNIGDVSLQIKGFKDDTLSDKLQTSDLSVTKVYPNPSTVEINILLSSSYKNDAIVYVYDANGRLIYQQEITTPTTTLNSSQWSVGCYWVKIKGNSTEETFTIIKE